MISRYLILLIFSTGFTALLNFIIQVYIARNSSEYVFGFYSVYTTLVLMGIPLITMGLSDLILKKLSEENNKISRLDINFLILILIYTALGFLFLFLIFIWYFRDFGLGLKYYLFMVFGVFSYVFHELYLSYLIGNDRKAFVLFWQPLLHLIRFLALIVLFFLYKIINMGAIVEASLVTSIILFLIIVYNFKNIFLIKLSDLSCNKIFFIFNNGFWFGLSGIFYIIYSQISSLYVGRFCSVEEAGYFNIGYTFLLMSLIIPNTIYAKFLLPKLHKAALENSEYLKYIYRKGAFILFFSGLLIATILYLTSEYILLYFYGEKYLVANSIFRRIIISIPLFYLVIHYGIYSYLNGFQKYKALVLGVTTIFSVILNYFLVNSFGVNGAALGVALVLFLLILLYGYLNEKLIFRN